MAQVGLRFLLLFPAAEETLPDWLVSYIGCRFRMTHLASFVPAESATLGIVDKSAWCWDDGCGALSFFLFLCPVFTRIQTRESVSKVTRNDFKCGHLLTLLLQTATLCPHPQVQSAFMIDLNQVSLALRNATPRSLILLDEFGKGTAATGSCISLRLLGLDLVKQPIYHLLVTSLLSVSWRNSEQMARASLLESCNTCLCVAPAARK